MLVVVLFSSNQITWAGNDKNIIPSFIAHGKDAYQQGLLKDAVNDFSRVLLLEKDNLTAKDYLARLSTNNQLPRIIALNLQAYAGLITFKQNALQRISHSEANIANLQTVLLQKGVSSNEINRELELVKNQTIEYRKPLEMDWQDSGYNETNPLTALIGTLQYEKEQLITRSEVVSAQHSKLVEIHRNIEQPSFVSSIKIATAPVKKTQIQTNQIEENADLNKEKQAIKTELFKEIAFNAETIQDLKTKISDLKMTLSEKDQKILTMTQDLVSGSLRISEEEASSSEQEKLFDELNGELIDLQSRFELTQTIIKEKDAVIDDFRTKLAKTEIEKKSLENKSGATVSLSAAHSEEIQLLNKFIEGYQQSLNNTNATLKEKLERIDYLNKKMTALYKKITERDYYLALQGDQIAMLQGELEDMKEGGFNKSRLVRVLKTKDLKIQALQNQVNEYKDDVQEKSALLKNQDKRLTIISKELVSLQTKLETEQEISKEKDIRIASLKNELSATTKQLAMYESGSGKLLAGTEKKIKILNETLDKYRTEITLAKKSVAEKETEISRLNTEIVELQTKFKTSGIAFRDEYEYITKDEKLVELTGMLSLYKGKLFDSKNIIKQKIANITTLEEQLLLVQTKLYERNKSLEKTQENFESLEEKINSFTDEINRLKTLSAKSSGKPAYLELDIRNLENELSRTHGFLADQLRQQNAN